MLDWKNALDRATAYLLVIAGFLIITMILSNVMVVYP